MLDEEEGVERAHLILLRRCFNQITEECRVAMIGNQIGIDFADWDFHCWRFASPLEMQPVDRFAQHRLVVCQLLQKTNLAAG